MKKFINWGMVLITSLMFTCYACSNESEEPDAPQTTEMVNVKFDVKNIVSVTEMPMGSRVGTDTYNDLYLIEIRTKENELYAVGLFDLSKDITATLPEGGEFWFQGVAVKDAKEKIWSPGDGEYSPPVYAKLTNQFTTDFEYYRMIPDRFILAADTEEGYEDVAIAKDLEVYILYSNFNSSTNIYTVSDDNESKITIDPNRILYIGTEFKTEDMKEGKLYVSFSAVGDDTQTYTSPEIEVTNETTPAFNTFSFNNQFTSRIMGNTGVELTLHMRWVKADGTEAILPNSSAKITVKNGYKYAITINVDDTSTAQMEVTNIVTPTFGTENTEEWYINEGSATKK